MNSSAFPTSPWKLRFRGARAVPVLGLALFLLIGVACVRIIVKEDGTLSAERAILVLLVCLLLAASASDPPRHETRYVFFLYPLGIIMGLLMLVRITRSRIGLTAGGCRRPALIASLVGLPASR